MSIESIVYKIITDAEAEAEKIKAEAIKNVEEIEKNGKAKIEDACSLILQKAKEESNKKKEKARVIANVEFKKGELEEKQIAISMAFDLALKEIQNLPEKEYQELIEKDFLNANGTEEVIISPQEKRINEEFLSRINGLLVKNGKKGNLKLSNERRQIPGGGFILKNGNIESNNSFSLLFESIRNKIELKVSEILFG